jgi:hypothetical protein
MTTRKFDHLRLGGSLVDNTDTSKRVNLSLAAIPTSTTRTMIFPNDDTTLVGDDTTQTLTNKTITGTTNTVEANALKTTGTAVTVSTAAPPTTGQVLTATSATSANWQTVSGGSLSVYLNQSGTTTLTPLSTLKQWYGRASSNSSTITFNLTDDGSNGGAAIFTNLATCYKFVTAECNQSGSNGPVINVQSTSANNKQVTVRIRRSNSGSIIIGGTYQGLTDSTVNCNINLYVIGV